MSKLKLNKACAVIRSCNTLDQLWVAERYLDLCNLSVSDCIQARILILEKRADMLKQVSFMESTEMRDKVFGGVVV